MNLAMESPPLPPWNRRIAIDAKPSSRRWSMPYRNGNVRYGPASISGVEPARTEGARYIASAAKHHPDRAGDGDHAAGGQQDAWASAGAVFRSAVRTQRPGDATDRQGARHRRSPA